MKPTSILKHCLVHSTLLALAGLLTGCATQSKVPLYSNSEFNAAEVDRITLLPVLDLRQAKKVKFNVSSIVLDHTKSMLESKHYSVLLDSNGDALAKLTLQDLDSDQPEWVKTFPCTGSRWIMIFVVHNVSSTMPLYSTGNAELSGYLFDRQNGTKLWQDSGIAAQTSDLVPGDILVSAAIGVAEFPFMSRKALNEAISNCMLSFPPKPKSK